MPARPPVLIATCWTTAGDVRPDRADNLGRFALAERIDAAARAGYRGFGFWLGDLLAWRESGRDYATLRRFLGDAGIETVELEFLSDWHASGERRSRSDAARTALFEAADALGARHLKVMPPFLPDDLTGSALSEEFAALCDDARRHRLAIGLEMLPFSRLPNLPSALAMVEAADAANGGLLIDIWHVMRSGGSVDDVSTIPANHIVSIELCDALLAVAGTLGEDTMCRRRLCGEGEFDVRGFIAALERTGYQGPFGVEILADDFRKLTLDEACHRSFDTTAVQLDVAALGQPIERPQALPS